jgi:DNA polymerase III epsilon subunit-like protein
MKILFFDTETNGLPHVKKAPYTVVENWPRTVSIAWRLCDMTSDGITLISEQYHIVLPCENITWSAESMGIHGISMERAKMEGTPIQDILSHFQNDATQASVIVAHNMAFDRPVLLAEFCRLGLDVSWWPVKQYCTMDTTKGLCKLPSKYSKPSDPYKYPRLPELHMYLFGDKGDFDFHSAREDVRCLVKCFEELNFRRLVPLEDWRKA